MIMFCLMVTTPIRNLEYFRFRRLNLLLTVTVVGLFMYIFATSPSPQQRARVSTIQRDLRFYPDASDERTLRDERHLYRYKKTMFTEMPSTKFLSPWGDGPNCSLVDIRPLPTASVIIAFHDHEQVSLILHTVHSIIQRTPKRLLKEIILIDDNTQKDDLQDVLMNYIKSVFDPNVVRLYKSKESLGLIRARNLGAKLAEGDVIVCMDSHMEVQPHWLDRLLYEIHLNSRTLATSYLDWFTYLDEEQRWEYKVGGRNFVTFFDWQFEFGFERLDPRQAELLELDPTRAVESPITVGTIWAMDRQFFSDIGAFDCEMLKWGGENLELPIRVWLFGGRVVNVPCSAAGHYEGTGYRDYRTGWEPYFFHNYKRVAEVWFGEYKKYIYYVEPRIENAKIGDISDRLQLTHRATHNISWFLDNVFPQLVVPDRDSFSWGWVRNIGTNLCLETVGSQVPELLYPCKARGQRWKQNFLWNKNGELRYSLSYMSVAESEGRFNLIQESYFAHSNQSSADKWVHWKGGPIMEWESKQCLEAPATINEVLHLAECDVTSTYQQWEFLYYTDHYNNLSGPLHEVQHPTKMQQLMRKMMMLITSGNVHDVYEFLKKPS